MSDSTVDAVVSKIRQEKDLSQFQSVDMDEEKWRIFVNKCRRDLDLPIQKGDTVQIDDIALKLSQSAEKGSPDPEDLTDEELQRAIDQLESEVRMPGGDMYRDELRVHREEAERRGLFVGSRDEMESVREDTLSRSVEKKGSVRKNGVILDVHDGYGDEEVEVMLYKSGLSDREYMGSFEVLLRDDQGFWIEEIENMAKSLERSVEKGADEIRSVDVDTAAQNAGVPLDEYEEVLLDRGVWRGRTPGEALRIMYEEFPGYFDQILRNLE